MNSISVSECEDLVENENVSEEYGALAEYKSQPVSPSAERDCPGFDKPPGLDSPHVWDSLHRKRHARAVQRLGGIGVCHDRRRQEGVSASRRASLD